MAHQWKFKPIDGAQIKRPGDLSIGVSTPTFYISGLDS